MSLIPVLINAGSLLTPVLCTLLSSSLALSFVNGVSKDALVHPWMSVETIKEAMLLPPMNHQAVCCACVCTIFKVIDTN